MSILRDISVLWALPHTLVMFALLFESRYSRKKTVILTLSTMLPLLAVNYFIYILIDGAAYVAILGTCVLPSLIFFWFLAKHRGIETGARISLPKNLPVNESELATVFANAIENAIHACEKLPEGQRSIDIQVLTEPCFMLQVKNSFDGAIAFDEEGVPISRNKEHGFGTRSIVTFCEKYGAFYEFKSDGKYFFLRIVFN